MLSRESTPRSCTEARQCSSRCGSSASIDGTAGWTSQSIALSCVAEEIATMPLPRLPFGRPLDQRAARRRRRQQLALRIEQAAFHEGDGAALLHHAAPADDL